MSHSKRSNEEARDQTGEETDGETVDVMLVFDTRFEMGRLLVTPGADQALKEANVSLLLLLVRHSRGDWGDLDEDDKAANDAAMASGEDRILSSYVLPSDENVWIITEADRSATTALLPSEY